MTNKLGPLTMRNFMAIGEPGITIEFVPGRTTLISGHIGAGKTTLLEGIHYALTGKPYKPKRKVGELVNEQNKKNCLVTLQVENQHTYKIERGMKPKKFNIFKNGILVDKLSDAQQNKYIVEEIFGYEIELIFQLDVLGANYVPPLELTTSKRRELAESIFELGIYAQMKDIVHNYAKDIATKKIQYDSKIDKKELELEYAERLIEKSKADRESQLKALEKELQDILNNIEDLESELTEIAFSSDDFKSVDKERRNLFSQMGRLEGNIGQLDLDIERAESMLKNITDEVKKCRTCGQDLPRKSPEEQRKEIEDQLKKYNSERDEFKLKISSIENQTNVIEDKYNSLVEIRDKRRTLMVKIESENRQASQYKNKIELMRKPVKLDVDIDELEDELDELEAEREIAMAQLNYFKFFKEDFLADSGFKSFILSRYIPEMNKFANQNLQDYAMDCSIEMQEDFNFKIFNKKGKEVSYARFSSGQQQILNISVWEALTSSVKTRRNAQTNLIFIDEILDKSLDHASKMTFLESLEAKVEKYGFTAFVVSHSLDDHENMIRAELDENGFSKYEFINDSHDFIDEVNGDNND